MNEAIRDYHTFLRGIEAEDQSKQNTLKRLLLYRLFDHAYSAWLLAEVGMLVDSFICLRSAVERYAYFRLVCAVPDVAARYEQRKSPKPPDVRKELEDAGKVELAQRLYDIYRNLSAFVHISRETENVTRFNLGSSHGYLIGGRSDDKEALEILFKLIPNLLNNVDSDEFRI